MTSTYLVPLALWPRRLPYIKLARMPYLEHEFEYLYPPSYLLQLYFPWYLYHGLYVNTPC